ncbi:helix-turn-helix domain-containing protein [Spirosoma flavum]|uniref:Helix-turn-helix domain-containing protein n=1 Tax=Spirosoma flavum TaxID=2048557 RepID=A0ABW6ALU2_9BACT
MATYKPSDYELLRRRCAQLKDTGWKQTQIATALGLTEGWVSRTLKKYQQDGQAGLAWR